MNSQAQLCALAPRLGPVIPVRLDPELTARPLLDDLLAGRFTAHGESHAIGDPIDWRTNPSADVEWLIVLHKFHHAPGLVRAFIDTGETRYIDLLKAHLLDWIRHVEPGFIAADVTGRRVRNWVYALSLYTSFPEWQIDAAFVAAVERSIRDQAAWLRENLHPARNHRTLELFAVFIAGVWLEDRELTGFALAALAENARTDFLPDGVHVELSSHYHCIVLRSLVDAIEIARLNGVDVPPELATITERAKRFARALHKPDGRIPALGDADTGDYRYLLGDGCPPGRAELFSDAGYVFLRDERAASGDSAGAWLVFDCGPLGAGNHGHLDCLSFELAACGRSLIVDPGRYVYFEGGGCNERAAFRGTAAHNLVQVDGREQTAYRQGGMRMKVAGPPPAAALIEARPGFVHGRAVSAEYDVVHDRRIVEGGGWWLIHDVLTSDTLHEYDLRFQLSPEAQQRVHRIELPCGAGGLLSPNLLLVPLAGETPDIRVQPGWVAPAYGIRHAAPRLSCRQRAATGWFATLVVPFASRMPSVRFAADPDHYALRIDDGRWIEGRFA